MLRKCYRTIEEYMSIGAKARICKDFGSELIDDCSKVLRKQDVHRMVNAYKKINKYISKCEDQMFKDHPELSNEYLTVFYGVVRVGYRFRNDVDRQMHNIVRDYLEDASKKV